jgi:hypothetical protein
MLDKSCPAVLPGLTSANFAPHVLHDTTRDWPETNCYVDLWIELLAALKLEPRAALGFTVAQDFEGDQFTFFKFPLEDLALLYGIEVQELAIYESVEAHALEQITRGRMVLVEVDGFHLPDTRGVSYQLEHTKTTIGINRLDPLHRRMDYFHNAGFFTLSGDDYDALLAEPRGNALFPYVEFAKFGATAKPDPHQTALNLLRKHLARRPSHNPILAFRTRVAEAVRLIAERQPAFFHKYAFNTARQLGANFELLASHLRWLEAQGEKGLDGASDHAQAISAASKVFQFQLARAVARKRFDGIETLLDPIVDHYNHTVAPLAAHFL